MLIWLALCMTTLGLLLLTLFGLFFSGEANSLADWAYRIGLLLLTLGVALTMVAI